jgi:hypothetical protein
VVCSNLFSSAIIFPYFISEDFCPKVQIQQKMTFYSHGGISKKNFDPKKSKKNQRENMQLFSAEATIFSKKNCP